MKNKKIILKKKSKARKVRKVNKNKEKGILK